MDIELEIKDIKHDLNYAKKCEYDHITLDVYKVQALLIAYEKEKEKRKKLEYEATEAEEYIKSLKEKNMELTNSYNQAIKETNEENRRCMLLAVENQDLKEKIKN